jgi:hypothetical protein
LVAECGHWDRTEWQELVVGIIVFLWILALVSW